MKLFDLLMFISGLTGLLVGGDALVRGASGLARSMGISPLVVGLTAVAFGTSAPELAVSMASALAGAAPIALGNVVGSNVFNILLVLGGAGLVTPLLTDSQLVRFDIPILVTASFALAAMSLNGVISHMEAALLFGALLFYLVWTVRAAFAAKEHGEAPDDEGEDTGIERLLTAIALVTLAWPMTAGEVAWTWGGAFVLAGLLNSLASTLAARGPAPKWMAAALVLGLVLVASSAHVLVIGAVGLARSMGVSDTVIGLTVVAAGTSAPEAIATFMAARRNETELAIGNVVGSNIFNVLCIVGLTGLVAELPVPPELMRFDYPFMAGATLGLWPLLWWRKKIDKPDALIMLALFAVFMGVQVWRATG